MNNGPFGNGSITTVVFQRESGFSHARITFIGSQSTLLKLIKLACFVNCRVTMNADTTGTEMALCFIHTLH